MSALRAGARAVLVLSIICGGSACVHLRADDDWPMWLQNPARAPAAQFRPTGPLERDWTFRCDGVFGGLVVSDGVVFFGSRDGYLYAVEDATGRRLWRASVCIPGMEVPDPEPEPLPVDEPEEPEGEWIEIPPPPIAVMPPPAPYHYYWWRGFPETGIMGTPCVDAERVYVGALDGSFQARDRHTGREVWQTEIGGKITSSPLLLAGHGTVVVGTRAGTLTAMDGRTGRMVWTHDAQGPLNSSPAYDAASGNVVVGAHDGVLAVRADSGAPAWRYHCHLNAKFDASPVIARGRVYVASWEGEVVALSAQSGELLWRRRVARVPIFSSLAVHDDMLYAVTTRGVVVALEADSGAVSWHAQLGDQDGVGAYVTPVASDPVLLAGSNEGYVSVLDKATGDFRAFIGRLHTFVRGAPTVTAGAIYVTSEESYDWGVTGTVVRLSCREALFDDEGEVRQENLPRIAAIALGLMEDPFPQDAWGWELVHMSRDHLRNLRSRANDEGRRILAEAGVITRWDWAQHRRLTRYELAAFFHKLLWEPNPFGVTLPAYEEAALDDAQEFPQWVHETVPRVVGLGLVQPIDGRFMGHNGMTLDELHQSLARARELMQR